MNSTSSKMGDFLAENFPSVYVEYWLIKKEEEDQTKTEKEVFDYLIKKIEEFITENCKEIIGDEIKEFFKTDKFKKIILSIMIDNSSSSGSKFTGG